MSTVAKNLTAILFSQVATWATSLLVLVVAPRYMGADGFGTLNVATNFVGFFGLVAAFGTVDLLVREVARDHTIVGSYVLNGVVLKTIMVAVLSLTAIVTAYLIGYRGQLLLLVVISCGGMLIATLTELFYGALAGMERMARPMVWTVVQVYLATGLSITVLVLGGGVVAYLVVVTIASMVPLFANGFMLRSHLRGVRRLDPAVWKALIGGGLSLFLLSTFNQIYGHIDIPILGSMAGSEAVGWYAVAYRWVGIPIFIVTAVMMAYFPSFSAHGKAMNAEFTRLVNRASRLVLLVAIPGAIGMAFVAEDLIDTFYPPEFAEAVPLLQILAIHIPLAALNTVLAMALIASDRHKRYVALAGVAAVLNPVVCIVAIRATDRAFENGAIGAAIVTVGTELFIMTGALVLRSPGVMDRATVGACLRGAAAALMMIPFLVASEDLPMPVRVIVGVGCYGVASLAFRSVRMGTVRRVTQQLIGVVPFPRPRASADLAE